MFIFEHFKESKKKVFEIVNFYENSQKLFSLFGILQYFLISNFGSKEKIKFEPKESLKLCQ